MSAISGLERHPCFSEKIHFTYGRVHLPVACRCDTGCAYCDRKYDCANENRPGVTSRVMSPKEALNYLARMLLIYPQTSVVGISGPGEPLQNDETFAALRLVKKTYPELILCMSTNGALLTRRMDDILSCGVDSISETINTLRGIAARVIYPELGLPDAFLRDQQEGLHLAVASGLRVKINMVLIPGVNELEVREIARFASSAGVFLINLTPLIPCGKMAGLPPPGVDLLKKARQIAGEYLPVFTHCQQCRADAAGIPGRNSLCHSLKR